MFKYVGNKETNNDIPGDISKFLTEELVNYIIVKDGFIIKKKLDSSFDKLGLKDIKEAITEKDKDIFDNTFLNDSEDDAYQYNLEEINSGVLIHVPKNLAFMDTLHIFYIQENSDLVNNTLIVLEPNSEFKYFEYIFNSGEASVNFVSNSIVKENAKIWNIHKNAKPDDRFQFERCGYFVITEKSDPKKGKFIFNRVVELKESK